jgi:hypothetical protein
MTNTSRPRNASRLVTFVKPSLSRSSRALRVATQRPTTRASDAFAEPVREHSLGHDDDLMSAVGEPEAAVQALVGPASLDVRHGAGQRDQLAAVAVGELLDLRRADVGVAQRTIVAGEQRERDN